MVRKFYKAQVFVLFLMHFYASGYGLSSEEINSTIEQASTYKDLYWHGSSTTLYLSVKQEETYEGWVKAYYEFSNPDENRSQIRKLCRYLKGRPVDSLVWKPTGERCLETTLSGGEGQENHWHTNGTIREVSRYANGLANGKYQMWYPDGSLEEEGFYIDGFLEGKVVHYRTDGSIWARSVYRKGEPVSGQVISWKAKVGKSLITFKDGKKDGPYLAWDEAGRQTMEAKFADGNLSGLVKLTEWFENGKKSVESHYLNNQIHGRYTQWTEQGKVVLEGNYTRGKKQGTWRLSPMKSNRFIDVEYIDDKLQKRKK